MSKYNWAKRLKAQGKRVKVLDDEPELTLFESKILEASGVCKTFTDIVFYAEVFGFCDVEEFVQLVINCQQYKKRLN